ncbi:hypothetical protein [Bacillus sp. E214]|uniref:hypothetical protein n=1 Tax=Bacillus sp. E214 TaxID=2587156 RepID=UPI0011DF8DF2|nr:hypothetical protein [Bacillus sp. E214]
MKPNYTDLGYADKMGPKLRMLVEKQLCDDLVFYGITANKFKFDWSESCIEGNDASYLDGVVENFRELIYLMKKITILQRDGWSLFMSQLITFSFLIGNFLPTLMWG